MNDKIYEMIKTRFCDCYVGKSLFDKLNMEYVVIKIGTTWLHKHKYVTLKSRERTYKVHEKVYDDYEFCVLSSASLRFLISQIKDLDVSTFAYIVNALNRNGITIKEIEVSKAIKEQFSGHEVFEKKEFTGTIFGMKIKVKK